MTFDDVDVELSETGRARRAHMLVELQAAVVSRRRRRRATRVVGLLALAALAFAGWHQLAPKPPSAPPVARGPEAETPGVPAALQLAHVRFERISDDPGVLARYAVATRPAMARTIGNEELIALLAQDGRPTGLILIPGKPARTILTDLAHDDSSSHVPLDQLVAMQ